MILNTETFDYTKCSQDLTQLKKQKGFERLKTVDYIAFQSFLKNRESACKNHFELPESDFPKFQFNETLMVAVIVNT